uniref:cardiolipin synthase (CMP-forming) n=1 Tax=Pavo cristatus TaxID=9049 RepID=A0A8C9GB76_PAVCR
MAAAGGRSLRRGGRLAACWPPLGGRAVGPGLWPAGLRRGAVATATAARSAWPGGRVPRSPCASPGGCCARPSGAPSAAGPGRGGRGAYENPWTIPNILSMARMGLAPVLGYLIVEENFNVALGVFVLAGVTDLLDGFIARNWANQKSALGSALDPLADKILISVLYVSLTCANLIPACQLYFAFCCC